MSKEEIHDAYPSVYGEGDNNSQSASSQDPSSHMNSIDHGMEKVDMPVEQMSNLDESGLKRDLHLRHMVMIAISGTIGTGLFLTR